MYDTPDDDFTENNAAEGDSESAPGSGRTDSRMRILSNNQTGCFTDRWISQQDLGGLPTAERSRHQFDLRTLSERMATFRQDAADLEELVDQGYPIHLGSLEFIGDHLAALLLDMENPMDERTSVD